MRHDLLLIQSNLQSDPFGKSHGWRQQDVWNLARFTPALNDSIESYLTGYKKHYQDIYNRTVRAREALIGESEKKPHYSVTAYKNRFYNESLADLLTRVSEKKPYNRV